MAKWGEGDPRWIVEERPDATNVNNWHWTEKNACQWSRDKLRSLLVGLELEGDHFRCVVTDIEKCEGEAVVNNRKGKLIYLYEWDIVALWQGKLRGSDKTVEGKIEIPNLSEENDVSEVDITFTFKEQSSEAQKLRELLYFHSKEKVREKLNVYVKELKEEFSKGLILPKKEDTNTPTVSSKSGSKVNAGVGTNTSSSSTHAVSETKIVLRTLEMHPSFHCTGSDLYNVLTQQQLVSIFTNGPVVLNPVVGGVFELFGGNVQGTFQELESNRKIVQKWRLKKWPANHYSTVTIVIEEGNGDTSIHLKQTGVPKEEYEGTLENWDRYYWNAIKRSFGYGSFIM